MGELRLSIQTLQVLSEFLQAPQDWRYGYDISRNAALKSGTLYPILMRLAERKLLETRWETPEAGKPPRHMYKLTASGLRYAREHVSSTAKHLTMQAALGGARS
ncbi:MAG: PadR family transcriptional regulator [Candidatus Korobacteraceae bacterium]